jgi:hypothetical protein
LAIKIGNPPPQKRASERYYDNRHYQFWLSKFIRTQPAQHSVHWTLGFYGVFEHFSGFRFFHLVQNAAQPGCQADWRSAPTDRAFFA